MVLFRWQGTPSQLWYPGQYDYFYFLDEKIEEELVICLFGLRSNPLNFCSVLQGTDHGKPHFPRFLENQLLIRLFQE